MEFHHYTLSYCSHSSKKKVFYILHILHTCLSNAIQEGGPLPTPSGNTLLVIFRVWPGNSSPPIPGLSSNSFRTLLLYPQICDLWKFSPPVCQKCRRKREKKFCVFDFKSMIADHPARRINHAKVSLCLLLIQTLKPCNNWNAANEATLSRNQFASLIDKIGIIFQIYLGWDWTVAYV